MPASKTTAVAAEQPDGSVAIHHIVLTKDEITEDDIGCSLVKAGLGNSVKVIPIDLDQLPSREHREAWVLRDGRVEVDPSRIKPKITHETQNGVNVQITESGPDYLPILEALTMKLEELSERNAQLESNVGTLNAVIDAIADKAREQSHDDHS